MQKMIEFPIGKKTASAYLAAPKSNGPGVLVLHAWWGLNDFCKEFCRRLAKEGFVVVAPDLYRGAVADTIAGATQLRGQLKSTDTWKTLFGSLDYLHAHEQVVGRRVGLVGFSLGAFYGLGLVAQRPESIGAVTTFYGSRKIEFAKTEAAYLAHFADTDPYVSKASRKEMETRLLKLKQRAEVYVYPGTGHWFFEKDRTEAYEAKAAQLAWSRTAKFFKDTLAK